MNPKTFEFRPFELVREKGFKAGRRQDVFVPGPRSGHRICCDNNNLYVFGGYNFEEDSESHNLYKEILCYNFVSKKWKQINDDDSDDCPDELASSSMLMFGKSLVVFGGTSYPFGMRCSDKVTLVDVSSDDYRIQELETRDDKNNHPPGQYGMSVCLKDNYLYTVGGTQGFDYTADIYRLDFTTQMWQLLTISRPEINPDEPIGRYRHEIAIDDRFIYIFGGGTGNTVFDLKCLPAYDLIERKWIKILTHPDDDGYPKPRKCHSLVQHTVKDVYGSEENFVFIAGGNSGESGALNDIWKLSLKTRRWHRFRQTSLPSTIFFHDACITPDGLMYIFGGIATNNLRTNKLLKMWVTIPKLSAIAWESLIHYFPTIYAAPKNFMLEKGVPMHFVSRVHP